MKVMFVGDMHLSRTLPYSKRTPKASDRLEDFRQFAKGLVKFVACDPSVRHVVLMGDVFDKTTPDPAAIACAIDFVQSLALHAEVHVIPGNHEAIAWTRGDYSTGVLEPLNDDRVHYYHQNKACVVCDDSRGVSHFLHFFPWKPEEAILRVLPKSLFAGELSCSTASEVHYAVMHQTIDGVTLNGKRQTSPLKTSHLHEFEAVFCGHVHEPSLYKPATPDEPWVYYTGPCFPTSFADPEKPDVAYGVLLYDFENQAAERLTNKFAPRFAKVVWVIEDSDPDWRRTLAGELGTLNTDLESESAVYLRITVLASPERLADVVVWTKNTIGNLAWHWLRELIVIPEPLVPGHATMPSEVTPAALVVTRAQIEALVKGTSGQGLIEDFIDKHLDAKTAGMFDTSVLKAVGQELFLASSRGEVRVETWTDETFNEAPKVPEEA